MYGKKECEITYEQGKLAIYTPYNADFVTEIKKIDGAKWNGSCWMVDKEHLEQVQGIVKSIYGDVDVSVVRTLEIKDFIEEYGDTLLFCAGKHNVSWRKVGYSVNGYKEFDYRKFISHFKINSE